ncbi:Paf1 family protein [Candida albicans]|uniref:Paf1 family protein n=1 Tax=Candida albicans TaxID=5476 RepID=A0A8H6BWU5_CANAX|nr:Paf1 family protein [Candida albicans]
MERIDDQLGLDLNLINNRGFLSEDKMNESVGKLKYNQLHPNDRALLRDAGIGKISKNEPEVSFLRRTEYISDRPLSKGGNNLNTATEEIKVKEKLSKDEHFDADSQLQNVEESFTVANESLYDLKNIKHPKKKHLRAVNTWPLLPDTSMLDNVFLNLRFMGSASINRELNNLKQQQQQQQQQNDKKFDEKLFDRALESSLFKPIKSEGGEWISMYSLDATNTSTTANDNDNEEQINDLYEKLHSTKKEQPINLLDEDEESLETYKFKYTKNYDMTYQPFEHENEELAIKFVSDEIEDPVSKDNFKRKRKMAYYYPINERTYDGINFILREPSTNELKRSDTIRSEYDPMEYEGEDEEEEEEEEEEEQQEEEQQQQEVETKEE